ncbi:MAG: hypothetical protein AAGA99_21255 [Actinomycetota bacterium]
MSRTAESRRRNRQAVATANREARAERTDAEQLDRLVAAGHGHCAEAVRLRGAS